MIKFRCKNCGQRFNVSKIHAGKKGRCPKCKSIVVIPKIQTPSPTVQQNDSGNPKVSVKNSAYDLTLLDVPQKDRVSSEQTSQYSASDIALDGERELKQESAAAETEPAGKRKLPWIIDIFLYPITVSGIIHLVIFSFLPRMLLPLGHPGYLLAPPIFVLGFLVIYVGYFLHCL